MKKMIENLSYYLFVTVLLLNTSNVLANNSKPELKILNSERKIITLNAGNLEQTTLTIRVFDKEGVNLLREDVAINNNLSKAYNFSKLPNGTYEVEIEDLTSIRNYVVIINKENFNIIENGEKEIYKPIVNTVNKSVSVNLLNLEREDIVLSIFNRAGEKVYSEQIKQTAAIHKKYDLSVLPTGKYSVSINSKTKSFNVGISL